MQRKAEEREPADPGKRRDGLSLRGHAPAEGFAAGDKREIGQGAGRPCDGGADGGVREWRRTGPLRAALHVGKLVAQRGNATCRKAFGNCGHEWMRHAGAGAMSKDVTSARAGWHLQQSRDVDAALVGNADGCRSEFGGLIRHGRGVLRYSLASGADLTFAIPKPLFRYPQPAIS